MKKLTLPPTEFFYQRAMRRSAELKAAAAAIRVELEAVEQAIKRTLGRADAETLKRRAEELNQQIKELDK